MAFVNDLTVENTLTHSAKVDTQTTTPTSIVPLVLDVNSTMSQVLTGSAVQIVVLPDATTLKEGHRYEILCASTAGRVYVQNHAATSVVVITPGTMAVLKLLDNTTAAGVWAAPKSGSGDKNTDGGRPDSVYLASQLVDGGGPNG